MRFCPKIELRSSCLARRRRRPLEVPLSSSTWKPFWRGQKVDSGELCALRFSCDFVKIELGSESCSMSLKMHLECSTQIWAKSQENRRRARTKSQQNRRPRVACEHPPFVSSVSPKPIMKCCMRGINSCMHCQVTRFNFIACNVQVAN